MIVSVTPQDRLDITLRIYRQHEEMVNVLYLLSWWWKTVSQTGCRKDLSMSGVTSTGKALNISFICTHVFVHSTLMKQTIHSKAADKLPYVTLQCVLILGVASQKIKSKELALP